VVQALQPPERLTLQSDHFYRVTSALSGSLQNWTKFLKADHDDTANDLDELREWLDLISFTRRCQNGLIGPKPGRSFRMRDLYDNLFQHLACMQAQHKAVCLIVTYTAETDSLKFPTATVVIVSLRSKIPNPAAAKLTSDWCEQKLHGRQP